MGRPARAAMQRATAGRTIRAAITRSRDHANSRGSCRNGANGRAAARHAPPATRRPLGCAWAPRSRRRSTPRSFACTVGCPGEAQARHEGGRAAGVREREKAQLACGGGARRRHRAAPNACTACIRNWQGGRGAPEVAQREVASGGGGLVVAELRGAEGSNGHNQRCWRRIEIGMRAAGEWVAAPEGWWGRSAGARSAGC